MGTAWPRCVIKYFSLYSVYIQCEGFAKLTFYLWTDSLGAGLIRVRPDVESECYTDGGHGHRGGGQDDEAERRVQRRTRSEIEIVRLLSPLGEDPKTLLLKGGSVLTRGLTVPEIVFHRILLHNKRSVLAKEKGAA